MTNLRRSLALAAGLVAIAAPVLSACGAQATDRPNVLANGGYDIAGDGMRVVASRIVASSDGQGMFIATIALNPSVDAATSTKAYAHKNALVGLAVAPDSSETVTPSGKVHVDVGTEGVANLATTNKKVGGVGGIPVTGDFKAGDIIPIVLTFADGAKAIVQTPVVTDCFEYSGAGTSSYAPPSADPSPSVAASPGTYACAYPSIKPIG